MAVNANNTLEPESESSVKPKREGEKRLTLALDGETYKRLKLHAAATGQTHQAILEAMLLAYLSGNALPKYAACPFCGSKDVFGSHLIGSNAIVTCNICAAEAHADIWNTRAKVAS